MGRDLRFLWDSSEFQTMMKVSVHFSVPSSTSSVAFSMIHVAVSPSCSSLNILMSEHYIHLKGKRLGTMMEKLVCA